MSVPESGGSRYTESSLPGASYSFDYTNVPLPGSPPFPNGQSLYRPLIQLRLSAPSTGRRITCTAMVDSGADHCIFPLALATALGLDPLTLESNTTGGVGNVANPTYFEAVRLEILVLSGASLVIDVYAGFCAGVDAIGMGLLGQTGFFERFRVMFDHQARTFQIADQAS